MIHWRWVLRSMQRTIHRVIAFGPRLTADVLHYANVTAFDDHVGGVVVAVKTWAEVRAVSVRGELSGIVGRARQQDWRGFSTFGNQDNCVEFDAVAHRDHHLAAHIIKSVIRRFNLLRSFAR